MLVRISRPEKIAQFLFESKRVKLNVNKRKIARSRPRQTENDVEQNSKKANLWCFCLLCTRPSDIAFNYRKVVCVYHQQHYQISWCRISFHFHQYCFLLLGEWMKVMVTLYDYLWCSHLKFFLILFQPTNGRIFTFNFDHLIYFITFLHHFVNHHNWKYLSNSVFTSVF